VPFIPGPSNIKGVQYYPIPPEQIESAVLIDQSQLSKSKLFSNRETYIQTLPKNLDYMEIGVAWGYYSKIVAENLNPSSIYLLDRYDQDHLCWSARKFGSCQCYPKHIQTYDKDSHKSFIEKEFSKYKNVNVVAGNALRTTKEIDKTFDYIYIDITNDRKMIQEVLEIVKNLVKPGGVIGLNDYLIYDGIIEDAKYGSYQSVNEFLFLNKEWSVDGIALHPLGFYDIYLRKGDSL
jgi:predicted O-methyltransferase YrrM